MVVTCTVTLVWHWPCNWTWHDSFGPSHTKISMGFHEHALKLVPEVPQDSIWRSVGSWVILGFSLHVTSWQAKVASQPEAWKNQEWILKTGSFFLFLCCSIFLCLDVIFFILPYSTFQNKSCQLLRTELQHYSTLLFCRTYFWVVSSGSRVWSLDGDSNNPVPIPSPKLVDLGINVY